jgi:hypothetical protein
LVRVILFAALGAATGAAAIELTDLLPSDYLIPEPYTDIIPGLIFGIAFGVVLRRLGFVRTTGAVAFAAASTLSQLTAVTLAVPSFDPTSSILVSVGKVAPTSVTGFIAGAVGGGLLAGATALLIRRLRWRWPLLIAAGAVLGAFLPVIYLGNDCNNAVGSILFYQIWQGGYAATLAAILPRAADKLARFST